ncbi:MAG: glycosyltransferase family 9 protein [Planctomycetota bacterium]
MNEVLILKLAALGDVLRTTSILPGLCAREPDTRVTWVTAKEARPLVAEHALVREVVTVDTSDPADFDRVAQRLGQRTFDRLFSFDDEIEVCRLASRVPARHKSGAILDDAARPTYTPDVEEWFGMGLLARDGKAAADERKRRNRRSHAEIFASMLGIAAGRPQLPLRAELLQRASRRVAAVRAHASSPCIGLNTGAGERWPTKALPIARVVEFVREMHRRCDGLVRFLLLGGRDEAERNAAIRAAIEGGNPRIDLVDPGTDNSILDFAALVSCCDLLLSSDSLGMHIAIAREVPTVAFFAPTSAAEIDLFGLGEKVVSTDADYCSYRTDASNESITVERLTAACMRVLAAVAAARSRVRTV